MAATARRKTTITFSGDVEGEQELDAAINTPSPATITFHELGVGDNAINVASFDDAFATAVTIVPNGDNTAALTLKGHVDDVGIRLHNTDPTTIALDPSCELLILNAGAGTEIHVRCFWS